MLVTENVAQWKQDRLAADGAMVKVVPILQIPNLPSREATYAPKPMSIYCRWIDQFTKLQLWKLTEYDRIVYMDSDLLPLANTEELFSMDIRQTSSTEVPFEYSFAASPNLLGKGEDGSINVGVGFNAGFFVLKPDTSLFDKIWELAMVPEQPWNLHRDMEQGLLNEVFKSSGQAPMVRLHWSWNVKDMPDEWMEAARVVHARWFDLNLSLTLDGG